MSRLWIPVIGGVACLAGLFATGVVKIPTSTDALSTDDVRPTTDAPVAAEGANPTQLPKIDDDQSRSSSSAVEHRAREFVRRVKQLASTGSTGHDEANERVRKLFLAAHRGQSPLLAARVAEQLVDQLSGTEIGAQAEAYRIVLHVQNAGELDSRTVQLLADFSRNYASSELPVQLYKWTGEQLTSRGQARSAIKLITLGVSTSRGHRDVSGLEAYLRMTKRTHELTSRAANSNSSFHAKTRRPAKPSLTDKNSKYGKHLGKPLHLTGMTSAGRALSSSSLRGHWTVVHFWATWCPKCVSDTPDLKPLYDKYANQRVRFVGVSLDSDMAKLKKFSSDNGVNWPQLVVGSGDEAGWDTPLADQNGISSIPAVFLLSPDGIVVEAGLDVPHGTDRAIQHHAGL